jgi:PhnB protein
MNLNAYLHFNDNCREAFEFYRAVFGGEFDILSTFAEGPSDMPPLPEHELVRIMHVSLPVAGGVLMGSDTCSAFGPPPVAGNNFSISISTDSKGETDRLFASLAEGGNVAMQPQEMFWGAYFGMCTDRFGVNWMLSNETHAH